MIRRYVQSKSRPLARRLEAVERELEPVLRFARPELRGRRLRPDHEREVQNEIRQQHARAERLDEGGTPRGERGRRLGQDHADELAIRVDDRRVRHVAVELSELARDEAALLGEASVKVVDDA